MINPLRAIDRGRTPLFIRVYQLLRKRLETGEWALGNQVPTIEQLMAEYDVSRATIREAMAQLEQEGLINRTRGRGTYVTGNITNERWLILPTDWHGLVGHIDKLNSKVVEIESGPGMPRLAEGEGEAFRSYWRTRRLNYTQAGQPYSLTEIYLAGAVYRLAPGQFAKKAILPLIDSIRPKLVQSATQRLAITTAGVETAEHLQLEIGSPVAEVRRVARDSEGRIVYLADIHYPARHLAIETALL
jgi:GntR family transcriptional regulator